MLEEVRTRSRVWMTALGACVLAAGATAPAASAASPSCKGRSLLRGGLIKVVDRTYVRPNGRTGHRYVTCPQGSDGAKPRRLRGSRPGARLQFPDQSEAQLVIRDPASGVVRVLDIGSGAIVRLRHEGRDPTGRVVVARGGEAAALVPTRSGRVLAGFDFDGTSYELDTGAIPLRSLRAGKRSNVTWTRSGARRQADLSEPAVSCADLGGERQVRTDKVNVVSFGFSAQFLSGEIDGSVERLRGCALPDGPVRVLGEQRSSNGGIQGGEGFDILDAAGTNLLEFTRSEDSQGEFTPEEYAVHDLLTDKRATFFGDEDAEGPNQQLGSLEGKPVVTATGQAAAIFSGPEGGQQVVGFDAAGKPKVLDSAAGNADIADSLKVSGTVLSWTNQGQPRTADLAT